MARQFSGTSDLKYTGDWPGGYSGSADGALTLACWAKPGDATSNHRLLRIRQSTSTKQYRIALRGDQGDVLAAFTHDGSSGSTANTTDQFSSGSWHHCCGVFGSASSRFAYLDGSKSPESTTSRSVSVTTNKQIEINNSTDTSVVVAEAAVWLAALTDAQVQALADGISPLLVRPADLAAYWPLLGANLDDYIGGLDFTATGTTVTDHKSGIIYPASPTIIVPAGAAPATANQASATFVAQQASPTADFTAVATQASATFVAQQAAATGTFAASATQALVTFSAQQATPTSTFTAVAGQATATFVAQQASASGGGVATANQASATFVGQQASPTANFTATANQASASWAAQQVSPTANFTATANQASATFAAQQASATGGNTAVANQASATFVAQQATATASFTATANQAIATFVGQQASPTAIAPASANQAVASWVAQQATPSFHISVTATQAIATFVGQQATAGTFPREVETFRQIICQSFEKRQVIRQELELRQEWIS